MKKALIKDNMKQIKNNFKRFISIMLMALLGVGFFAGINMTSPNMQKTLDICFDENNIFDIEVISTLGLTDNDIASISRNETIECVVGTYSEDLMLELNDKEYIIKAYQYSENNINKVELIEGSIPNNVDECIVEENLLISTNKKIGDYIQLQEEIVENEDSNLKNTNLKIVGIAKSALYISNERGSTKLGSGKINYYIYVHKENLTSDIYSGIYITVKNAKELNTVSNEYKKLIDSVKNDLDNIKEGREEVRYNEVVEKANTKLKDAEKELEDKKIEANSEIAKAEKKISDAKLEMEKNEKKLEINKNNAYIELKNAEEKIINSENELNKSIQDFELQVNSGFFPQEQIDAGRQKFEQTKTQIQQGKEEIENNKRSANIKFENAQNELNKAKQEIKEGEVELENNRKEFEEKVAEAEKKIEEAKTDINEIEEAKWYILDRNSNAGYSSLKNDSESIQNIARVFPVIFFVVATLISVTSITRMVEEQRGQIGTLKALGYNKFSIASKYIIYAILASLSGGIIGIIVGFNLIPSIIWEAYSKLYFIKDVQLEYDVRVAILGLLIASVCIVSGAIYACSHELKSTPTELMRPKSPRIGKKVLLERVSFIWRRLNFIQKVCVRNIFRYKKRFILTIMGVAACTSLILCGFGIKNSVDRLLPSQYETIYKYDMQVSIKQNISTQQIQDYNQELLNNSEVIDFLNINMQSGKIVKLDNDEDIQIVITPEKDKLNEFINMQSSKTEEFCNLEDDTVMVTEKIAKTLKIQEGDVITLKNKDDIPKEVKVSKIVKNYIYHYIYMSQNLYENLYGKYNSNVILVKTNLLDITKQEELSKKIVGNDIATSITIIGNAKQVLGDSMEMLNKVVWVLIISAGMLAIVVLYNLVNINISERIRELATIKVLGFYNKEVYQYIARESILLTIIGIIVGSFGGYFLNIFILETCETSMLLFIKEPDIISYFYTIGITVFFALIVNIATYFSLKKIDMIQSLKSVE